MNLTERHDLRTGVPVWTDHASPPPCDPLPPGKVDIAIVGAGIMGAMLVDTLAASGRSVAGRRRAPVSGSCRLRTGAVGNRHTADAPRAGDRPQCRRRAAAERLLAEFDGSPDPLAAGFDPYRFG